MGNRAPGLAGIVRSPTVSAFNRQGLSPGAVGLLDALDKAGFGDIGVNSGYRSPAQNARARGAKSSQHLSGNALDLNVSGLSEAQKASLLGAGVKAGARGVGLYGTGNTIHLDTRQSPALWGMGPQAYAGMPVSAAPGWARGVLGGLFNQAAAPKPVSAPQAIERRPLADLPSAAPAVATPGAPMAPQAPTGSTGLGLPDTPAQPAQPGFFGDGGFASRNKGALIGGLLGSTVAGPVGGLLGGLVGRSLQNGSKGTPSNAASAAMNAGWDGFSGMTSAQTAAARGAGSGGGSSGWGGGGLLGSIGSAIGGLFGGPTASPTRSSGGSGGFSSGASGPDGGKKSGSSSSSSGKKK